MVTSGSGFGSGNCDSPVGPDPVSPFEQEITTTNDIKSAKCFIIFINFYM